MPLSYIVHIHQEQQQVLTQLEDKAKQVEQIAQSLVLREKDRAECPKIQQGLKEKVFEICKLLVVQQKAAIVSLRMIEERVEALREDFTSVMLRRYPANSRE